MLPTNGNLVYFLGLAFFVTKKYSDNGCCAEGIVNVPLMAKCFWNNNKKIRVHSL